MSASCLDERALAGLVEGTLAAPEKRAALAHVEGCEPCRRALSLALRVAPEAATHAPATEDRYEVREVLGEGAMGRVYAGFDHVLRRRVALKWLTATGKELAIAEARALARLSHPNVVQVYDVARIGQDDVIAMELVEGPTLRSWLREKPRARAEVVARFRECARGLAAAHRAGLVHRDFKPANVLLGADGAARVVDFGLSRAAEQPRRADGAGTATTSAGTPRYMAPEVLRGERATPRSDQYSWAVALYEALVGAPPSTEPAAQDRLDDLEVRDFLRAPAFARLPRRLRGCLTRSLSFDPAQRFDTLTDAERALRPRGTVVAGAVGALAVSVGLALLVGGVWATQRCSDVPERLSRVWSKSRRAALERAWGPDASSSPVGRTVLGALDGWADAAEREGTRVCEAARRPGLSPTPALVAQEACLQRALREFATSVGELERLEGRTLGLALSVVAGLSSPRDCAVSRSAVDRQPLPAGALAEVTRVEEAVDRLRVQVSLEQATDIEPTCRRLEADARRLGWLPLLGSVGVVCGNALGGLGNASEARRLLVAGLEASLAGNDAAQAIDSAAFLLKFDAFLAETQPSGDWQYALGTGLARRAALEQSPEFRRLLRHFGDLLEQRRDFTRATEVLERVLASYVVSPPSDPSEPPYVAAQLGAVLAVGSGGHRGLAMLHDAWEQLRDLLGPEHPRTVWVRGAEASAHCKLTASERCLSLVDEVLALRERMHGPTSWRLNTTLLVKAQALLVLGRSAPALAVAARARDVAVPRLPATHPAVVAARASVAEALLTSGGVTEACADLPALLRDGSQAPADLVAELEWLAARCSHARAHDDAALRATAQRLLPSLGQEAPWARTDMQRLLDAADAGVR